MAWLHFLQTAQGFHWTNRQHMLLVSISESAHMVRQEVVRQERREGKSCDRNFDQSSFSIYLSSDDWILIPQRII